MLGKKRLTVEFLCVVMSGVHDKVKVIIPRHIIEQQRIRLCHLQCDTGIFFLVGRYHRWNHIGAEKRRSRQYQPAGV